MGKYDQDPQNPKTNAFRLNKLKKIQQMFDKQIKSRKKKQNK
jgi:hypothetical protein